MRLNPLETQDMNDPEIEFIYFDLGNVLVHFDHTIGRNNVAKLTGLSALQANEIIFKSGMQNEFESGSIDDRRFTERFNELSGANVDQQRLCLAISNIFQLNRQIVPLITQLASSGIPIGILSNTCSPHWEFVLERFRIVERLFKPEFRILSFQSNSMKPDNQIYADALSAAGTNAENIFFTDDREENVAAARRAGMQAELFVGATPLIKYLSSRNVTVNL